MEALITLYTRAVGIEAEKLQMIEDIEDYLAIKEPNAPTYKIQYQKIQLEMYVKVILNQEYTSPLKETNFSYVKIVNKDNQTKPFYFFIKSLNWKSQECVELDLIMDTLNSFKLGTDYTFSPKTIIQRQHKDRIEAKTFYSYLYISIKLNAPTEWESSTFYNMSKQNFTTGYIYSNFGSIIFDNAYCYLYIYDSIKKIIIPYSEYIGWSQVNEIKFNKIMYEPSYEELYLMLDNQVVLQGFTPENLPSNISIVLKADNPNINNSLLDTKAFTNLVVAKINERQERKYIRKVDLMSEDLNPQLYGGEIKSIEDLDSSNESWYLVYNTNQDEAVECYLIPEKDTEVNVSTLSLTGGVIRPENLQDGYTHILLANITDIGGVNPQPYFSGLSYGFDNFKLSNGNSLPSLQDGENCILELSKSGDKILGSVIVFTTNEMASYKLVKQGLSFITDFIQYIGSQTTIQFNYNSTSLDWGNKRLSTLPKDLTNGYSYSANATRILGSISTLDKTLSTLLKIIKLPYIPYDFKLDESNKLMIDTSFNFVSSWNGITNVLRLVNLDIEFKHIINTNDTIKSPNEEYLRFSSIDSLISNRNDFYESKMYNSEFFTPKFTYDSFSFIYKFELEDIEKIFDKYNGDNMYLSINFDMTRTINSRFAFEFLDYNIIDKKEDDYPNWLLVSRNNEEVIYNSAYLNYIRTGYNYDVKNKQAQATRNWVSIGASVLTALVGIAGSVATGGASVPLAIMGVSGFISTSATITNAISTQAQNERGIQEKLDSLKLQTASVSGSDDVDLMSRYNGNRLLYITYKVNDRVDKLLKDLFYYYGYKDNVSGIPNTNTRIWFNYIKCEPIIEFSSINMTQEIEDELKGIMRNGFTIIHKYNNTWDIEQVKENWEVSMLPYLS